MRVLLIAYDNESYVNWFPLNLGYLAEVLMNAGHEVEIYNQDIHHYPDEHLTQYIDKQDWRARFDFVGIGVVAGYWPHKKLLAISKAINATKYRPTYILGGHGPTPEPEYYLKKTGADIVVMGEAENTIVEVIENPNRSNILGIAYREGDDVKINPRRDVITDLDSIAFPAWNLFPMDIYRMGRDPHIKVTDFLMTVIASRGCIGHCNFCYRIEEGLRIRSVDNVLDEVEQLQKQYGITYIRFCDELTMSSEARATELASRILERGMKFTWNCNGRLNYASPEVLKLMRRAGCVFINYGIEAVDDDVLKNMHKGLTVEIITRGIEATLAAGIAPGFNMLWGNIGDNYDTLQKATNFLLKYDDQGQMRTIRPVTPYPGSPLYAEAKQRGLLKDCADFYENKHVNSELLAVNFTELSDAEFHECLQSANMALISNYYEKLEERVLATAIELYTNHNTTFRGFRQT